jgi:polyisoprenoid-binding protein YceI
MTPGIQLEPDGQPQLAAGSWRVDPAHSPASFAARVAGRSVRGRLPLTGEVLITEPIENSRAYREFTARLAARTTAVSTGSPVLDRLLTGSGFLDASTFSQITFQSEQLVWVPTGWRAIGRLQVKDTEDELACQLDVDLPDTRPRDPQHIIIASSWVIDSRWITNQWVPALVPHHDDVLIVARTERLRGWTHLSCVRASQRRLPTAALGPPRADALGHRTP